jgi:hypothetical protein
MVQKMQHFAVKLQCIAVGILEPDERQNVHFVSLFKNADAWRPSYKFLPEHVDKLVWAACLLHHHKDKEVIDEALVQKITS